jgi:hypothetical protein
MMKRLGDGMDCLHAKSCNKYLRRLMPLLLTHSNMMT